MDYIKELISNEKYNVELKEDVSFKEPKKYLKSISSFSNSRDIGYVIFGVNDVTKEIIGIKNVKKSYEELTSRIQGNITPSILPTIDIVTEDGKQLIIVKVYPGNHTPYYYYNKGSRIPYVRRGDRDDIATDVELNELILRGKNIGWDEEVTDKKYDDYTFESLNQHFIDLKNITIDKKELVSYELIKDNKLTNAAILFSDQNTNKDSFIACTRWNGLQKIIAKDDIEYHGSILDQIDKAIEFVKKHMSVGWVREGKPARRNIEEYSLDAIRERNYKCRGTSKLLK